MPSFESGARSVCLDKLKTVLAAHSPLRPTTIGPVGGMEGPDKGACIVT